MPRTRVPHVLFQQLFLMLTAMSLSTYAATDVWSPHITTGDWRTTFTLYNSSEQPVQFQLSKFTPDGKPLESARQFGAPGRSWFTLPADELAFDGAAHLTSAGDLLVKESYQYLNSHSVCELYLSSASGTDWVMPNSVRDWFSWTGMALVNPSDSPIEVELKAYRNQTEVGSLSIRLGSRQKFVRLSQETWPGVRYGDLDTIRIKSSRPIPAPISITGDNAQEWHLFFTAQMESSSAGDLQVWAPHVAAGDWQTFITLFNGGTEDASIRLGRIAADSSILGEPIDYAVGANGWFEVPSSVLDYNGFARLTSSSQLLVKVGYRYRNSHSVCEFFLSGHLAMNWVIPNPVRDWLKWTGVALVNQASAPVTVTLKAQQQGSERASATFQIPALSKFQCLSDQIWDNLSYDGFDTILIESSAAIPPPISITGDATGDRHIFFAAQEPGRQAGNYQVNVYFEYAQKAANWLESMAIETAPGAYRWPQSEETSDSQIGMDAGAAGIGTFFLELYKTTLNPEYLRFAEGAANYVGSHAYSEGEIDWLSGAAGAGCFLLDLWKTTGNAYYLVQARRAGDWLISRHYEGGGGYYWKHYANFTKIYTGFAHGAAGIGFFFARLFDETRDPTYMSYARGAWKWIQSYQWEFRKGQFSWPRLTTDTTDNITWCGGSVGIILFLLQLYDSTGEQVYFDLARGGMEWILSLAQERSSGSFAWTYGSTSTSFPFAYCHGTPSVVHVLYELYKRTKETRYLTYARGGAHWLQIEADSSGANAFCWPHIRGLPHDTGLLTGTAGVGNSLVVYQSYDQDPDYLAYAKGAAQWLITLSESPASDQTKWINYLEKEVPDWGPKEHDSGWYSGAAGIGLFFLRLSQIVPPDFYPGDAIATLGVPDAKG